VSGNDTGFEVNRVNGEMQELAAGAARLGIEIDAGKRRQLEDYADLLLEWNRKLNLVRVRSRAELLRLHVLDSLWCRAAIDPEGGLSLLDIGSGAGFPGIPLKICFPGLSVRLLEAQQRRSLFLQEAIARLGLDDCTVLTARAEDLARSGSYRESFDCAAARAVAPLATLVELALPLVKTGGSFVALKGSAAGEEIAEAAYALDVLGGAVERVIPYGFPGERGRNVVGIRKIADTPERYPRRAGMPAKRPLLQRAGAGMA